MPPKRLQRKRTKGSRLPDGCVCVTRPGKWGNPWTSANIEKIVVINKPGEPQQFKSGGKATASECVEAFRQSVLDGSIGLSVKEIRKELRGKDLACFCKLCPKHKDGLPLGEKCAECKPCHADALLEIANA